MTKILGALAIVTVTASPLYAKTTTYGDETAAPHATAGRETAAPPWSFACMTGVRALSHPIDVAHCRVLRRRG